MAMKQSQQMEMCSASLADDMWEGLVLFWESEEGKFRVSFSLSTSYSFLLLLVDFCILNYSSLACMEETRQAK